MAKKFEPFTLKSEEVEYLYEVEETDGWWCLWTYDDSVPLLIEKHKNKTKVVSLAERIKKGELDPWMVWRGEVSKEEMWGLAPFLLMERGKRRET